MADVTKTVAIVFKGEDQATAAVDKLKAGIKDVGDEAQQAGTKTRDAADEIDKLGKKTDAVANLKTAFAALAGSIVAKDFVEANVSAERFEKALVLLKGSTTAAAEEFKYISGLANTLGLNVRETGDAYVQLVAATKGTNLEGQATREIFEAVNKAMSSLGKSSADTQGALLAISQIVSKGNVSMEELRGQLGERLPGAFGIAAKSMGLTTQELQNLVESGQLTAEEFLPKFAQALRENFGDTSYVEGFEASLNRMKNALNEAYVDLGKSGVFSVLIDGLKLATAAVTGFVAAVTFLNEALRPVERRNGLSFAENWDQALARAAEKTRSAGEAISATNKNLQGAAEAGKKAGDAVSEGMSEAERAAKKAKEESSLLDKQLRALNVDPKKIKDPLFDVVKAFEELARNPAVKGDQIFAGFEAALKKAKTLQDLGGLGSELVTAFAKGKLSSEEFAKATELLATAQDKVQKGLEKTSGSAKAQDEALRKQAEAAEKAKEKAQQYALELEKLASNERIKLIEARVTLNVAQIEAQSKQVIAAFESINASINSSGDVLKSVFGLLEKPLDSSARNQLFEQIEKENKFREQSFKLQKELTEAQIKMIYAQLRAMEKGDSLIKIDGAGLQPHLEAFMWEILKSIQVRVNEQGLKMLLGV